MATMQSDITAICGLTPEITEARVTVNLLFPGDLHLYYIVIMVFCYIGLIYKTDDWKVKKPSQWTTKRLNN